MFRDEFNDRFNMSDSYTVTYARISIGNGDGTWEAALWAKNI